MDLSTIAPIEKRYNVQNPATGEDTGMILVLACTHDDRVKMAMRAVNDKIIAAGREMTEAQERDLDNEMAAAYVVGVEFEGDASWKGKTPDYSAALAKEIVSIPALKEQVLFEVRRTKDFYQA